MPFTSGESSSSARSSATPSITGTCTMPNVRTRPMEVQNGPLLNTATYWVRPPNTSFAWPNVPSRSITSIDW